MKISSVLAIFSSVLVENYVHCKSPTQIFPTKTIPLVALIQTQTVSLSTVIYSESFSCIYAHAYVSPVSFKLKQGFKAVSCSCHVILYVQFIVFKITK